MFGKSKKEVSTLSEVALFCMRDKVTRLCGPLFEAYNVPDAVRYAQRIRLAAYEDFELLCVGKFDRTHGTGEMFKVAFVHPWITNEYRAMMDEYMQRRIPFRDQDAVVEDMRKPVGKIQEKAL